MRGSSLINANPRVFEVPVTEDALLAALQGVRDPEHALSLGELRVLRAHSLKRSEDGREVTVTFFPTVPHCTLATLIGLCLVVALERHAPRLKHRVLVDPSSHVDAESISRQVNDKERTRAALENAHLAAVVAACVLRPHCRR